MTEVILRHLRGQKSGLEVFLEILEQIAVTTFGALFSYSKMHYFVLNPRTFMVSESCGGKCTQYLSVYRSGKPLAQKSVRLSLETPAGCQQKSSTRLKAGSAREQLRLLTVPK